jgi:hypothetical protein
MIRHLKEEHMKRILSWFVAASLLATLAGAQTDPTAHLNRRRALAYNTAGRAVNPCTWGDRCRPVYVITVGFQFGAVDLLSGTFKQIGPDLQPDVGTGLVASRGTFPSSGAPLLSLGFSGMLWAIDPTTGENRPVGLTGLGDCSTPGSYAPNCANLIGRLDETLYATDFAQNLYSVDPATGTAKLIGVTGIPPITFAPFSENPDGSNNVWAESIFSSRGKLYALFSTSAVTFATDPSAPPANFRTVIPAEIYEINIRTGHATPIAYTDQGLSSIVNVSDRLYAFDAVKAQVVSLDLTNGHTNVVTEVDAPVIVVGATPARPSLAAGH